MEDPPVVYAPLAFVTDEGDATAPLGEVARRGQRRGRKPKQAEVRLRELRLTPPDGEPVSDWQIGDPDCGITKLIACEEGGAGTDKALHYHCVVETTYTDDALKGWIRRVLRLTPFTALGNKIYRTGEWHENSYGYCVKHKQVKVAHGYTTAEVDVMIQNSDAYRKDVTQQRNALQRLRSQGREKQLKTIEQIVQKILNDEIELHKVLNKMKTYTAEDIIELLLREFHHNNIEFPTRNQMETMVNRIRWRLSIGRDAVVAYYARSLIPPNSFRPE